MHYYNYVQQALTVGAGCNLYTKNIIFFEITIVGSIMVQYENVDHNVCTQLPYRLLR